MIIVHNIRDRLTKLSPGLFYDTTAYYKEAMKVIKEYRPDYVISDYVAKQWNADKVLADKDVHILKNAIVTSKFDKRISQEEREKLRASLGFEKDDFVVLFCGRIVEVKGLEPLINAIMATNDEKIKLLIVGRGSRIGGN